MSCLGPISTFREPTNTMRDTIFSVFLSQRCACLCAVDSSLRETRLHVIIFLVSILQNSALRKSVEMKWIFGNMEGLLLTTSLMFHYF